MSSLLGFRLWLSSGCCWSAGDNASMKAELEKTLSTQPRDHWLGLFLDAGLAAGPVRGLGDVLEDEQLQHRNMLTKITIPPTGSAGTVL